MLVSLKNNAFPVTVLPHETSPQAFVQILPTACAVSVKVQSTKGPAVGAAWDKVKRWFWCSCICQRYEGPQNTLNAADVRQLSAWIEDESQIPEAVANFALSDFDLSR